MYYKKKRRNSASKSRYRKKSGMRRKRNSRSRTRKSVHKKKIPEYIYMGISNDTQFNSYSGTNKKCEITLDLYFEQILEILINSVNKKVKEYMKQFSIKDEIYSKFSTSNFRVILPSVKWLGEMKIKFEVEILNPEYSNSQIKKDIEEIGKTTFSGISMWEVPLDFKRVSKTSHILGRITFYKDRINVKC